MAQTKTVNMIPNDMPPIIKVSQYDVGRTFVINLTDGSETYTIPDDASIYFQGTKPSGIGFDEECTTFSGNTVTVETTETMTDEYGRFPTEIVIIDGDDRLGSVNILFDVEESPHPDGTTDGTAAAVISTITALVERAETACEGAEAAAESVQSLNVEAETLSSSEEASASYDSDTNTITFGIPKGEDGSTITFTDESSDGNIVITAS